jgi:hypothetical protein
MRYNFISICAAIVVALALTSARAQQASPTPTPRPLVHVRNLKPITPPRGWDPKQWATLRAECQEIFDKGHAGIPLSLREHQAVDACSDMIPWRASVTREPSRQPTSPLPAVEIPTPAPTPGSESSLGTSPGQTPIGPYGAPIIADSEDACVAGQGQPPDVAADVSPT